MRVSALAAFAALPIPSAGWAIQTIDDVRWPDTGAFAAYPAQVFATGRYLRLFVDGGLYRDSNIFRLSSGGQSENFTRLGVGLRADVPVSRQRFLIEARAEDNRFDKFSALDNTSYRASATWNWEFGNSLSGNLGAARERALTGFGQIQPVTPVRDLVTQDRAFGAVNYRINPDWRVRLGMNAYEFEHSEATRIALNNRQTDTILGADYVTGLQNTVGVQVRSSRGEFPNQQVLTSTGATTTINSQYKETEPSVVVHYNLGGKSSLDARAGYTKRTHDQLPARDFRGSTGNLAFHWTPTPKTLLDVTVFRETRPFVTNAIGSFLSSIDSTTAYVVARGVSLAPSWAITSQVVVQATLLEERDDFKGDPTVVAGQPQREDKFRAAMLGAGWSPLRPLLLSVGLERGERTSNIAGRDFKYNAISLNARYTFF